MMIVASSGLSVSNLTGLVGVVLLVLAALASASAIFKANRAQATIKVLQDLSQALQAQNAELKAQNVDQQHQLTEHEALSKATDAKIAQLTELVQSRAAVEELATTLHDGITQILDRIDKGGPR